MPTVVVTAVVICAPDGRCDGEDLEDMGCLGVQICEIKTNDVPINVIRWLCVCRSSLE